MLTVLIVLLIAALTGHYNLKIFGISMEAFKIVGGIIISFIGVGEAETWPPESSDKSPMFRWLSGGVKYAQGFNAFQAGSHTIRYKVAGCRNDQLASAENATGTPQ
jgi:hypothetical protein